MIIEWICKLLWMKHGLHCSGVPRDLLRIQFTILASVNHPFVLCLSCRGSQLEQLHKHGKGDSYNNKYEENCHKVAYVAQVIHIEYFPCQVPITSKPMYWVYRATSNGLFYLLISLGTTVNDTGTRITIHLYKLVAFGTSSNETGWEITVHEHKLWAPGHHGCQKTSFLRI